MTYIWTGKRAYLAIILDLFGRKPVGWAMSFSDSRLTMKALEMAWETHLSIESSFNAADQTD